MSVPVKAEIHLGNQSLNNVDFFIHAFIHLLNKYLVGTN